MNIRPGTVQRAFELARDSEIMTVEKIRRRLKAEGYIDWEFQLSGREIRRQLQALVVAKRELAAGATREGDCAEPDVPADDGARHSMSG